jgi:hypothetical protein
MVPRVTCSRWHHYQKQSWHSDPICVHSLWLFYVYLCYVLILSCLGQYWDSQIIDEMYYFVIQPKRILGLDFKTCELSPCELSVCVCVCVCVWVLRVNWVHVSWVLFSLHVFTVSLAWIHTCHFSHSELNLKPSKSTHVYNLVPCFVVILKGKDGNLSSWKVRQMQVLSSS